MDIQIESREELFIHKLEKFKKEQIMKFLKCHLCDGIFRFAHTILQCGHTFCKLCIFNYIRGFKGKNPEIKCPQCHTIIQNNYKKSISKDVYKQGVVDLLLPKFAEQQQLIVKRVSQLFPQCNVSFLLEQFNYVLLQSMQYRKRNKINLETTVKILPELVKQKLGITFDTFVEKIYSEQCFNEFKAKIKNTKQQIIPEENKIINVHPKTQKDYQYVNIKNQMKSQNNNILKLRRFLEKKLLENVKTTGKIPTNLIKKDEKQKGLNIQIQLWVKQKKLQNTDDLIELRKTFGDPLTIEYSIQF